MNQTGDKMAEKVLLIEDEEGIRKSLGIAIDEEDFHVISTKDGKEGLEMFEKEVPEIVITDLKMPEIDGMEVLHTVKRLSPNTEVIIITGFGDYDTVIQALREGAIDYLKKPIDLDQLIIALGRCKEKIAEKRKMMIKPTILLLEDEDITRKKLVRVLSKEDWNVLSAADGEEGMKIFYETKIDVVITDIKMPKKNGLEVLREVKKEKEDCEVIIVTGSGDETTVIKALRDGAIDYLKKPIDLDQMIATIEKALEKLNMRRSILYKVREIELAKEIILKITDEKEIVIDARYHRARKDAIDFAQKLPNIIQVGLLVVNRDMKVIYTNEYLKNILEFEPEVFDEKLMNSLSIIGIKDIDYDKLAKIIEKFFDMAIKEIEVVMVGKFSYITMGKIIITKEKIKQDAILMVIRGERVESAQDRS